MKNKWEIDNGFTKPWDEMTNEEQVAYRDAYIEFMYNPKNAGRCDDCPENMGFDPLNSAGYICGPCGQQNCWVDAHCRKERL